MPCMATRRIASALLILSQIVLPGCDSTGPVEDEYTFQTPLGGGSIKINRPGGPMFCKLDVPNGGCLWFTSAADPSTCIGECITVPPGGGVYQIPAGATVWNFAEDCGKCPCEPVEPPAPEAPMSGPTTHVFGSMITSTRDRSGFNCVVIAEGTWTASRAYERLRDKLPFDGVANVNEYIAVEGLGGHAGGMRNWRVDVRDDDQAIDSVKVYLDGAEVGNTKYAAGDWGFGSETRINLTVDQLSARIGGTVNLLVTWSQGGVPRKWAYRALMQ